MATKDKEEEIPTTEEEEAEANKDEFWEVNVSFIVNSKFKSNLMSKLLHFANNLKGVKHDEFNYSEKKIE